MRVPITSSEIGDQPIFLTADGDLRTLPSHWPATDVRPGGLDGFYASRLRRL
jgi:16S rRNA (cytosine967-C5)-methyltransferase